MNREEKIAEICNNSKEIDAWRYIQSTDTLRIIFKDPRGMVIREATEDREVRMPRLVDLGIKLCDILKRNGITPDNGEYNGGLNIECVADSDDMIDEVLTGDFTKADVATEPDGTIIDIRSHDVKQG